MDIDVKWEQTSNKEDGLVIQEDIMFLRSKFQYLVDISKVEIIIKNMYFLFR